MGTIKLNKNFANDEAKQTNIVKIPTAPNSDKTIQGKAVADADIKNSIKIKSSVTNNSTFVIQAPSSLSCWMVSNDGYGAQDKFYKNKLEVYARKGDAAPKWSRITATKPELNVDDKSIFKVELFLATAAVGAGYFRINGKASYPALSMSIFYDCTEEYKAAKVGDTLTFAIRPELNTSDITEAEFNMTTEAPKLIISYYDVKPNTDSVQPYYKNIPFSEYTEGYLNLANGDLISVINDRVCDNLTLPLNLSHIYKYGSGDNFCGTDWRLNINKRLIVADGDDDHITKFTFIDERGDCHQFQECYYYIENNEYKFLPKDSITIDLNGNFIFEDKTVLVCQICKGYKLIPEINDFINSDMLQQKSNEHVNLEEQIKTYENALKDYVLISDSDYSILKELGSLDKTDYENFIKLANTPIQPKTTPCYVAMTKSAAQQLMSLSLSVKQLNASKDDNNTKENFKLIYEKQIVNLNSQINFIISQAKNSLNTLKENFAAYYTKKAQLELVLRQTPKNFLQDNNGIINGFNLYGNLVYVSDSYGNYVAVEYDTEDKIISITDNKGKQVKFDYCNGLLQSITDSRGIITKYVYDTQKRLQRVLYADDNHVNLMYSTDNRLQVLKRTENFQIRLYYPDSLLTRIVIGKGTPAKTVTDLKIDRAGSDVTIDFSNGKYEKYTFDSDTRLIRFEQKDFTGVIKSTNYQYGFSNGNQITTVTSDNVGSPDISVVEKYNLLDQLVSKTKDWVNISYNVKVKTEETYCYDTSGKLTDTKLTQFIDNGGEISEMIAVVKYAYNAQGSLILTESYVEGEELTYGKNFEERVYDDKGNIIKTISWNSLDSSTKFYSENVYAENGQVIADKNGLGETAAEYEYVDGTNLVNSTTLPNGGKIAYGRNPYNGAVTSVTQSTEEGEANATDIIYEHGLPVEVKSGNTVINYTYDHNRKITKVSLNGAEQLSSSYDDEYSYNFEDESASFGFKSISYQTGNDTVTVKTEKWGSNDEESGALKITEETSVNGEIVNVKNYDVKGQLVKEYNYVLGDEFTFSDNFEDYTPNPDAVVSRNPDGNPVGNQTDFVYNQFDKLVLVTSRSNLLDAGRQFSMRESYGYDGYGLLRSRSIEGGCTHLYTYTYKENAARDLDYISFGDYKFKSLSDVNGRNTGKEIYNGENKVAAEYISYRKVGDHATNMPSTVWFGSGAEMKDSIKYKYDACGNICEIKGNGHIVAKYKYDALNRLIREDNKALNKTSVFTYDNSGNITERCEYAYTAKDGEELSELECIHHSYKYNGDKLLSYDGEKCEYNNLGNPTKYRNKKVGWLFGKFLTEYDANKFVYDGKGRRINKNGIHTLYDAENNIIGNFDQLQFVYDDKGLAGVVQITKQYYAEDEEGNKTMLPDSTGSTGVAEVLVQYFYRKDAQGNIVAILDETGAVVVRYIYDAWGNHAVLDANGNDIDDPNHVGNLNPFRYRGYYYDVETGLYFLQTRYYDPEVGRFISQDGVEYADPTTVNGLNLYAYCGNNPVMGYDPTGTIDWGAVGRFIGGLFLGLAGAAIAVASVMNALYHPLFTVACEFGLTIGMYGAALMGSAFDSTIYNDMDRIGWNPYNNDANAVVQSQMMSFYNGVPIIRADMGGGRSGSVGIIMLDRTNVNDDTVRHEFGHVPQLMMLGITRYLLCIGLPSYKEWHKRTSWTYYQAPWDAGADLFGGVTRGYSNVDYERALKYLVYSYFLGPIVHSFYKKL